jgi:hypothetical protein
MVADHIVEKVLTTLAKLIKFCPQVHSLIMLFFISYKNFTAALTSFMYVLIEFYPVNNI